MESVRSSETPEQTQKPRRSFDLYQPFLLMKHMTYNTQCTYMTAHVLVNLEQTEILVNSLDLTGSIALPKDQVLTDETFLPSEKQNIY